MLYIPHKINVPANQTQKLKKAISSQSKRVKIRFRKEDLQNPYVGEHTLLLTSGQILKLQRAQNNNKACSIVFSRKQIGANMHHEGGFLPLLAGLVTKILPVLLRGIASGVWSGGIERVIKGNVFFYIKTMIGIKLLLPK